MKGMCVRKPAISQRKRKQKEEENKSATGGSACGPEEEEEKIKWMGLVVLLIYAWGALQDASTLHFVLPACTTTTDKRLVRVI